MALKPLEIFRLLPKTNCSECGLATCLAFAQAVSNCDREASGCPHLDDETIARMTGGAAGPKSVDGFAASIEALRDRVKNTDLESAAAGLGAVYDGGRLTLRVLGREFHVDSAGMLTSMCHVNNWIQWLVLTYVSTPAPLPPEGRWVPFSELLHGASTVGYFSKRCEEPLRVIADEHTDIFFELLGLFGGKQLPGYDSDYAVALSPLPNVPMLVLYWRADDDFPSKLRVMFDPTADRYFPPELITGMCRGIVEMFQKIIPRHEKGVLSLPYL